jgi:MFS family permease
MDNLGAIGGPLLALALVSLSACVARYRPVGDPWVAGRAGDGRGACFEAGNVAATLLILRASELLAPGHGTTRAASTQLSLGFYTAYNLAATLASVPAGRLGDRRGPVGVFGLGVALFALSYAGFAITGPSVLLLAPWFVAAGVAIGAVETAEHAAVAALAPQALRGSAFGLLAAVQSFGNLAASAVAGLLWTVLSPRVAFVYLASWMVLALVGLLPVARHTQQQPR